MTLIWPFDDRVPARDRSLPLSNLTLPDTLDSRPVSPHLTGVPSSRWANSGGAGVECPAARQGVDTGPGDSQVFVPQARSKPSACRVRATDRSGPSPRQSGRPRLAEGFTLAACSTGQCANLVAHDPVAIVLAVPIEFCWVPTIFQREGEEGVAR